MAKAAPTGSSCLERFVWLQVNASSAASTAKRPSENRDATIRAAGIGGRFADLQRPTKCDSGIPNYAAAEVRSRSRLIVLLWRECRASATALEDSELLDGLLLIATTMRCDSQNFYEERMEVSRRNWNPRDFEVSRSGCIK